MITKALVENFRETVKPVVSQLLFGVNYEGMGTLDCEEFERDFDEILDLALAGYEQKVNNAVSTLDGNIQPEPNEGHWIKHIDPLDGEQYECSECGVLWEFNDGTPEDNEAYFCPKCGAKMTNE